MQAATTVLRHNEDKIAPPLDILLRTPGTPGAQVQPSRAATISRPKIAGTPFGPLAASVSLPIPMLHNRGQRRVDPDRQDSNQCCPADISLRSAPPA